MVLLVHLFPTRQDGGLMWCPTVTFPGCRTVRIFCKTFLKQEA